MVAGEISQSLSGGLQQLDDITAFGQPVSRARRDAQPVQLRSDPAEPIAGRTQFSDPHPIAENSLWGQARTLKEEKTRDGI